MDREMRERCDRINEQMRRAYFRLGSSMKFTNLHDSSCPPQCLNPAHLGEDATVIDVQAVAERKLLK